MLPKNINTAGRLLRAAIGFALLLGAYWLSSWILLIAALFTLFEACASWCLFYHLIGKNTCPKD